MKKHYIGLLALPIALAMMLTSCSKDDSSSNNNGNGNGNSEISERKIEKFTSISYRDLGDYTSGEKQINSFIWDGNKLIKRIDGDGTGWCWSYNYEGDRLSEILQYDGRTNRVYTRTVFTYTNNRISEYDRYHSNTGFDSKDVDHCKFCLNYNDKDEITSVIGVYDDGTTLSYQLTWQNGNPTQIDYRHEFNNEVITSTNSFVYDNKISWRSGMEVIAYGNGFNYLFLKKNNNPLSVIYHSVNSDGTESNSTTNYTYTYDGNYVTSLTEGAYTSYLKYTNTSDPTPTTLNVFANGNYSEGSVKGGGVYASGKLVKLLAIPKNGYHFVRWSNGSISNPLSFNVTNDIELQAIFEAD